MMPKYVLAWTPMVVIVSATTQFLSLGYLTGSRPTPGVLTPIVSALLAIYVLFVVRCWPPRTTEDAVRLGVVWLVLSLATEVLIAVAYEIPARRVLEPFNILAGNIWGLPLAVVGAGPYVLHRLLPGPHPGPLDSLRHRPLVAMAVASIVQASVAFAAWQLSIRTSSRVVEVVWVAAMSPGFVLLVGNIMRGGVGPFLVSNVCFAGLGFGLATRPSSPFLWLAIFLMGLPPLAIAVLVSIAGRRLGFP